MKSRLIIIGDSFATPSNDGNFYGKIIEERYNDARVQWYGMPSRDAQSVLDIWTKLAAVLNENDSLVVVLPAFSRTRLPIAKEKWETSNIFDGEISLTNRFIGTSSYIKDTRFEIEFFGNVFERDYYESILHPQSVINSSKASEANYFEIIHALKKLTKANTYVFTWTEIDCDEDLLHDKRAVEKELGIWETLQDLFRKGEGEDHWWHDEHWSVNTHYAFAKFLIKRFKLDYKFEMKTKIL